MSELATLSNPRYLLEADAIAIVDGWGWQGQVCFRETTLTSDIDEKFFDRADVMISQQDETTAIPTVISQQEAYQNPFVTIKRVTQLMPAGNTATFYIREEPDVAVCLPIDPDGRFILLKEYRPGPAQFLMEIPGGCVDPGEEPAEAARREVLEEVGYAGDLTHLASTYISAYSNARKHIYLMRDATKIADPVVEPQDLARPIAMDQQAFELLVEEGAMTDLDAALAALRYLLSQA